MKRSVNGVPARALFIVVGAMAAAACGTTTASGGTTTASTDAAGASSGSAVSVCAGDSRAETYSVGLTASATDGAIKVSFVDAEPAPPTKGNNVWTVHVVDAGGKPVTGATITVKPYMPDHGHPSSITPQVMPKGPDGTYEITLVNFFMPGIWQITLDVKQAGGKTDAVIFTFCVDA